MFGQPAQLIYCGCYHTVVSDSTTGRIVKQPLPQVNVKSHSTILSNVSRTTLTQTFVNPFKEEIADARYIFPLYAGVSVVDFWCEVGDRIIRGVVKERQAAKAEYDQAVRDNRQAALLEQHLSASDTFSTRLGNIPASSQVVTHTTYLGELQHDAQVDGIRFTIPSAIASRYSGAPSISHDDLSGRLGNLVRNGKMEVIVDVKMEPESKISTLQSPSHPVTMTLGRTSVAAEDVFEPKLASATYTSKPMEPYFTSDFVLIIKATNQDKPFALLETHPTIPSQRAIMTSLVPKFNLPTCSPEIVFIIDRSGSMAGKIWTLRSALEVFLKSLPVGIKFNICSFGSSYSFMWEKSRAYDSSSLDEALKYVRGIEANMGGTEMMNPVKSTVENRLKDKDMDVLLLTDGQIWDQSDLFEFINVSVKGNPIRFFSLGIGEAASHSLIQGIAKAGDGFAQTVAENEELDKKVVRMLKGALTPHIKDYTIEIEYDQTDDDEYELIEKSNDVPEAGIPIRSAQDSMDIDKESAEMKKTKGDDGTPISLFDSNYKEAEIEPSVSDIEEGKLPRLSPPKILQAPYNVPSLFPFNRTSVYLLLSPETNPRTPKSVTVRATSEHGPLVLTIPVEDVGRGSTIHQLAARKLTLELEEGRGWVYHAKDADGQTIVDTHESKKEELVKREAVRLGVQYQVGGKWCSFVAVEKDANGAEKENVEQPAPSLPVPPPPPFDMPLGFGGSTNSDMNRSNSASKRAKGDPFQFNPGALPPPSQSARMMPPMAPQGPYQPGGSIFGAPSSQSVMGSRMGGTFGSNQQGGSMFGAPSSQSVMGSRMGGTFGSYQQGGSIFGAPSSQSPMDSPTGGTFQTELFGSSNEPVVNCLVSRDAPVAAAAPRAAAPPQPQSQELPSLQSQSRPPPPPQTKVHALISQQRFEGSWVWQPDTFASMGVKSTDVEVNLDWSHILGLAADTNTENLKSNAKVRDIMATLAVLAYLETQWAGQKEVWELVFDKAISWVNREIGDVGGSQLVDKQIDERLSLFKSVFP